jgi:hypothetical protein
MARSEFVDAGFLVALTETLPDPVILTPDSDFRIYPPTAARSFPA